MNTIPNLLFSSLIGLMVAVPAQLAPAQQQPGSAETQAQPPAPGIDALIRQLGDDSYRSRIEAERALRERGKAALDALRKAGEQDADPEVQWRARRLVRQIERGERAGLQQRQPRQPDATDDPLQGPRGWAPSPFPGFPGLDERFERLFEGLERDFRMDIPRQRFFQDDFFQDLRAQMDAMRQQMQQLQGGAQRGSSMSMQMGPDGVRVEMKVRNEKGEEETKVYEAPDLETFRQKYPGVLEQNGIGGFGFHWGPLTPFATPPGQQPLRLRIGGREPGEVLPPAVTPELPADADSVTPPEDRRLGVLVRSEIPAGVREFLGLEEGVGLQVQEVQAGTLAERLGLQADDIVLRIAGRTIRGVDDVQAAVGGVAAGKTVEVVVNRRGGELTLTAAKSDGGKERGGRLERRRAGEAGKGDGR